MKRLALIATLFTASLWAQTSTTYNAPTGSVNPQNIGTLYFDGGGSASVHAGVSGSVTCTDIGFDTGFVSYALTDGTSATLNPLSGVMRALGGTVNNCDYQIEGRASGVDSAGHNVTADVQFVFHIFCRSGRGGGCYKTYQGGSLTLTVE